MDLKRIIQELYQERERITAAISSLEAVVASQESSGRAARKRRGRKPGMSEEERAAISERMRQYWQHRKTGPRASDGPSARAS